MNRTFRALGIITIVFVLGLAIPAAAHATHWWGGYHWARKTNPFTLKLGDNVSNTWDPYLGTASSDWSTSVVLDTTVVTGQAKANCRATSGRVEVCNKAYGSNGWLGLAQIWVSGSHITQGVVKMNDTYFNTGTYNTPEWRQMVMCQEIGHTFGLDHQDETFNNPNLGTCMDYTNDPSTNQHPNQHDYDMLANTIYAHTDSSTTVGQSVAQGAQSFGDRASEDPGAWGNLVRSNGHVAIFERDFGGGNKIVTFVIFAVQ